MDLEIKSPIGSVIGIGKLKIFCTKKFKHNIPTLTFIVSKSEDGNYVASCLHLMVDGTGGSPKNAIAAMQQNCTDFLETLFSNPKTKETAWEQLEELFLSDISDYWNAYKKAQLALAKQGIGMNQNSFYEEKIRQLQEELDEYKKSDKIVNLEIVDYMETKAA